MNKTSTSVPTNLPGNQTAADSWVEGKRTVVGVDIAKRVFQLHWVEIVSGEIVSVQRKRAKFLEHFANRLPCLIGMEACGGSQHWAREQQKLGHEVRLWSARMVKASVSRNKNDAADARAIWTAVQQPGIKAVAVKSEGQQAVLPGAPSDPAVPARCASCHRGRTSSARSARRRMPSAPGAHRPRAGD